MGIDIFKLMNAGMTYEQAVRFEIKFCIVILIMIGILYLVEYIIKKYFNNLYKKLKIHNIL